MGVKTRRWEDIKGDPPPDSAAPDPEQATPDTPVVDPAIRCLSHRVSVEGNVTLVISNGSALYPATLPASVVRHVAPSVSPDQWLAILTAMRESVDYALQQAQGGEPVQPTAESLLSTTGR